MAVKTSWYENDSRFIPGHYQPATLIDLGLSGTSTAIAYCAAPACSTKTSWPAMRG